MNPNYPQQPNYQPPSAQAQQPPVNFQAPVVQDQDSNHFSLAGLIVNIFYTFFFLSAGGDIVHIAGNNTFFFILNLVLWLAGAGLCGLGYMKARQGKAAAKNLAFIGLVLSVLNTLLAVLTVVAWVRS